MNRVWVRSVKAPNKPTDRNRTPAIRYSSLCMRISIPFIETGCGHGSGVTKVYEGVAVSADAVYVVLGE